MSYTDIIARVTKPLSLIGRLGVVGGLAVALGSFGLVATTSASAAVGPPTGVNVVVADTDVAVGQGRFTVSWQPVTNAIAYSVVAYQANTDTIRTSQTVAAPATSAELTGLDGGVAYEVTVAAADAIEFGTASDRQLATALTVPTAPVVATATFDNQASATTVTWRPPSSTGGRPILTYEIYADGQLNRSVPGSDLSASISGEYTIGRLSVRATNSVGSSAVTASVVTPGAPRAVEASAAGSSVSVSWLAPSDDGGGPIASYLVQLKDGAQVVYESRPTTRSASFASVANGTYSVTVQARNSAGLGEASAAKSVTVSSSPAPSPSPGQVPGPPTGVTAQAGDSSAIVNWQEPASEGSFAITNYRVTSTPGGVVCLSANTVCVVTGLTNDVDYTFTVAALNGAGYGSESAPSNSVTPTADPAPEPAPDPEPTPEPTPPEPTPDPGPSPAVVALPDKVVAVKGQSVRIRLVVDGRVGAKTLRMIARTDGKRMRLKVTFSKRPNGDVRATFDAPRKKGRYRLVLIQTLEGERFVLDRSILRVKRR